MQVEKCICMFHNNLSYNILFRSVFVHCTYTIQCLISETALYRSLTSAYGIKVT